jgi:acetyl-CoA acetyltransferase
MQAEKVVVAAWGHATQSKTLSGPLLDPLGLMAAAALRTAEQTGRADALLAVDAVFTVKVMSAPCDSAAERLAALLGARPRLTRTSAIGGNSPQRLINKAAGMIARRELESVLIAGAETYYPRDGKPSGGIDGALFKGLPENSHADDRVGATPLELRHGIRLPVHGFPLYETALWAESGLDIETYRRRVGALWSGFSQVAASHPNAWSRKPRRAEEIITPGPTNRWVAFPYTKFMTSLVSVDMGAAVLLTTARKARTFPIPGRRPVYFVAGADVIDRQRFLVEKSEFTRSPALEAAVCTALERSRMDASEIECFDLYSCFPCAVALARRALKLSETDDRPLTLTGGLGFFRRSRQQLRPPRRGHPGGGHIQRGPRQRNDHRGGMVHAQAHRRGVQCASGRGGRGGIRSGGRAQRADGPRTGKGARPGRRPGYHRNLHRAVRARRHSGVGGRLRPHLSWTAVRRPRRTGTGHVPRAHRQLPGRSCRPAARRPPNRVELCRAHLRKNMRAAELPFQIQELTLVVKTVKNKNSNGFSFLHQDSQRTEGKRRANQRADTRSP